MKILITGGHGQLGHDVRSLLGREHDVMACSSKELDISDKAQVKSVFSTFRPQLVVNCAAYTAVDNCEKEKTLAWAVNALGPEYLAVQAEELGTRMIHISTDYVFNGNKPHNKSYTENDFVAPLSEYGKSKLAGEDAVAAHCSNHLILRTAWLYGLKGNNFLKTMLRLSLADPERQLRVVDDQYGSLTWTATLARQIEALLPSEMTGIAHATATEYSTWYQGACYFLDTMGVPYNLSPCSTAEYPTPAHRPANSILKNHRLEEAGVSVFTSWKNDIDQFVAQHRNDLLKEAG